MANHKSALKRIRSNDAKRLRNRYQAKTTRTFIKRLKGSKIKHSEKERPGINTCRALGGVPERVTFEGAQNVSRCVLSKEHSSISLNLLESWNGSHFEGPGPSL